MSLEKLQVKAVSLAVDKNGILFHQCTMSDGSFWICDIKGENWKQQTLSFDELTTSFQNMVVPEVKKVEALEAEAEILGQKDVPSDIKEDGKIPPEKEA